MKRPHGRKSKEPWNKPPAFKVLNDSVPPMPFAVLNTFAERQADYARQYYRPEPRPVAMGRLYQRLDNLSAIAKNPLARGQTLGILSGS